MSSEFFIHALNIMAGLFIMAIGTLLLVALVVLILDLTQTKNAVRRNYPVVGHFREIFSKLGEFFRQYFFAMDREEMPFNRAQRTWIYHAAENGDNTVPFGSTRNLEPPGTNIFVNCPFPTLETDAAETQPMEIGPHCKSPYMANSIFNISGMSYGAISTPAVLALSNGARMARCWMNTGEGALSPHHLEGGADIIFQIGTAKYGVRNNDGTLNTKKLKAVAAHDQVKMFEIKLSQGAKPGKGGMLPGVKVTEEIAGIRGIKQGEDSISPNRHPEISNVGELLDFIDTVRTTTGKPTGIKTVVSATGWLEGMFKEIHKRGLKSAPDFITVDGGDGGTGAAPMALIDNVGLPLREALPMVADGLTAYNLKGRIRLIASGKLVNPSEVAWAICAGADFINSARGFLFALGCIQALKCNKNTCPTGITTHNKRLQKGLNPKDKAVKAANYCLNMIHEVEIIAHSCGASEPRQLNRNHVRIVQDNAESTPLATLHPVPDVKKEYKNAA